MRFRSDRGYVDYDYRSKGDRFTRGLALVPLVHAVGSRIARVPQALGVPLAIATVSTRTRVGIETLRANRLGLR